MLETLFGEGDGRRWLRFGFLMALSMVVAVMGISLDSAAVVIGAMLIAPLMSPLMAFAAALTMGWPRRMVQSGAWIVVISAGSVALAWLLAEVQPSLEVTQELLTRTSPDGRDLAVALAAGAAGAYATTREDISGALPGVAVAVALVPPLASIGVALALDRGDLAEGAGLLYVANLVAMILASSLVFLATGFVPWRRLLHITPRVMLGVMTIAAVTAAIAVPLARQSFAFASQQQTLEDVEQRVDAWLGPETRLEVDRVRVDDNRVTVDLVGPEAPPSSRALAAELVNELGETVEVRVRWSQRSEPLDEDPGAEGALSEEALVPLLERWLADGAGDGPVDRLGDVALDGDRLSVDVIGPVPPPSAATLVTLVESELGVTPDVSVRWTEQRVFRSDAPPDASVTLRDAIARWVRDQPGLTLVDVTLDGASVTVDLIGAEAPSNADELVDIVERELGSPARVQVGFTVREVLLDTER